MSGSELNDERAAVAGQVKGSKRKRQIGSDSEDDVSLDEESDFEPEEYGTDAAKPKKKKLAGSKPVAAVANDGDNDDLVEDEEDAARLAKMSEFDREMLLAERAEQRQQKIQRDQILAAEAAAEQAKATGAQRRSGREVREETAKKSAIEELKAARQRKSQGQKAHDAEHIDAAGADSDEQDAFDHQRREGAYYSDDSEEDGEDRGFGGTRWAARDRTEEDEEAEEEADFEELKSIQVRRHKLEEWISKPHFETTLPGSMVRVVAGEKKAPGNVSVMLNARPEQRYMVVRVVGVEQVAPGYHKYLEGGQGWKSPYPFGPDGSKTSKWLRVLRGKSERLWPLAQVSNSGFTEEEFASWHRACENVAAGGGQKRQITRGEVAEVHKRLIDADSYVYTAEDVARMLEEKRLKGQGTRNVAIEMARLERERDAAAERNDEERVLEVQQEIAALEATAAAADAAKKGAAASMAQLNKKNVEKNFKSSFKSGKDGGGGGGGAAGTLDPFSRRATRTKNYWNTKGQRGEEEGDGKGDGAAVLTEAELADLAVAEAAAAAAAAAKAKAAEITLVDLSGLDLSLLDLPPKVAPIARKLLGSTSMAATSPGVSGGATLNLADYKRRYNIA